MRLKMCKPDPRSDDCFLVWSGVMAKLTVVFPMAPVQGLPALFIPFMTATWTWTAFPDQSAVFKGLKPRAGRAKTPTKEQQ